MVGVALERSPEMVAALVAILKRGAAYLPLDPREPRVRRRKMIERANPVTVLGGGSLESLGTGKPAPHKATPENLAYVIFTSGSTGEPKGVMVERQGMMNNLFSKVSQLPLEAGDGVGQTAPLAFDVSVWQLLAPLTAGARVEIMDLTDLTLLAEDLIDREIHILELVPSQLEVLLDELEKRPRVLPLRWLIPTGEALPPELCRRWFRLYPDIPLLNAYGPAECSDDVTTHVMREPPSESVTIVPIGKPLPHFEVHLLDSDLNPTVEGEIGITGIGVGRGYIGEPELTRASFLEWKGKRLYRTGDLGRRGEDGSLLYLGRSDFQVKVRGERIELAEIEAAIRAHPEVRSAVVVPWERRAGDVVPVAYVVPEAVPGLQGFLRERLTNAMHPLIVGLERLPLNSNGKVDRSRLPAPGTIERTIHRSDTTEAAIAGLFTEVLGLESLPIDADFFSLGGDSLSALRLVGRIESAFAVRLSPSQLVATSTPAALADLLKEPPLRSRLVCLKKGEGTPLLFLPGAGGHVVYLAHLARRLKGPFFGLEARGLDGTVPPAESVEEEVPDVLAAIREISPQGPIRLAGHSVGAWTAFEAARVLTESGTEVEFLGLVGMPAPHLLRPFGEDLDSTGWLRILGELFSRFFGQDLKLDWDALRGLAPDQQLDRVVESLKAKGILPPDTDRARMRSILRVYRSHHRIDYRPPCLYKGRTVLFRTFEGGLGRPVLGWERSVEGIVKVRFVLGGHLSMMNEPHVERLAEAMSEEMEAGSCERL